MVIGFLGAGVMARAIAQGLVQSGAFPATDFLCTNRTEKSAQLFLDAFPNSRRLADNTELVEASNLIVLGIKPQMFPEVLPSLKSSSANKLFLSIAAGLSLDKIRGWLDPSARVVRAMPNTPLQIGEGASVYAGASSVTPADYALVHRILAAAGHAYRVDESQIDSITALSGSGPAYVFHFIDALARAGASLGLPEKLALDLARQTVFGSAKLAAQSPLTPLELAAQVKSPRGTTLAGCAVLEQNDALNDLLARCLAAARARAQALSRGEA